MTHRIIHATTDFAEPAPRDMQYRNTNRCAWIDEGGERCEVAIRKTSTHCQFHAAVIREAQKWESESVAPAGMELICPPGMAGKWPDDVRAIFRANWSRFLDGYYRRLIARWWESAK
jgi:hypothetical protein